MNTATLLGISAASAGKTDAYGTSVGSDYDRMAIPSRAAAHPQFTCLPVQRQPTQ